MTSRRHARLGRGVLLAAVIAWVDEREHQRDKTMRKQEEGFGNTKTAAPSVPQKEK